MAGDLVRKHEKTLYIAILAVVFASVFSYVFNPALDLGGDNCNYYMYATSIAQGHGYADLGSVDRSPTSAFPPGYPFLMSAVRVFTDSIIAQKILNGLFLLTAAVFLMLFIRRNKMPHALALACGIVILLNYRVLQFATIMMSEMSYLMFTAFAVYLLYLFDKRDGDLPWWKNPHFYLLILCSGYAYQIRTQGIALPVAISIWMLTAKKWFQALGYTAGFALTTLPWTIRNHAVGLGANRYLDQIIMVNQWRPEEGYVSFGELVSRGFSTLKMLLTKAVPNTVTPYLERDYAAVTTFGEWIAAAVIIALIIYGFMQYRRYFWFFFSYTAAVIGIICLWSAPSENRYIVTLVPILEIGLVTGIYALVEFVARKYFSAKKVVSPLWLLVPAVLIAAPHLKTLNEDAGRGVPPAYRNYFRIAGQVRESLPEGTVVCSRKPSLFYVYSQGPVCNYRYTADDRELIEGLVNSRADYVVLEQLGYSSTGLYLYPAIEKNPELFPVAMHLPNPDTYLLKFDRQAAIAKFGLR